MNHEVDFKLITKARVCLRGEFVGILEKESEEKTIFQYDEEYCARGKAQISTSLPVRREPYISRQLHPFFDNLITEGWLLQHTEKVFHIDKSNRFALLMATGKSPIGAVTIHPLDFLESEIDLTKFFKDDLELQQLVPFNDTPVPNFNRCPSCFKAVDSGSIHQRCAKKMWGTTKKLSVGLDPTAPQTSFARVIYGGSISGAQKKGMFRLNPSKGLLTPVPSGAQYILKPNGVYPELPENEHVTMAIAKKLGFDVPPFSILHIDQIGIIFAIKRFDQFENEALMVEDMGQVICVPSSDKYQSSNEKIAAAIAKYSSAPTIDLNKFYRRLIFSYFIGNADMHLKNWSLLENPKAKGSYMLSPCYDFLNTRLPIPQERIDIGLLLNGKSRNLKWTYFRNFGEKIKIPKKMVEEPFEKLESWLNTTEEYVSASMLSDSSKEKYLEIVKFRCKILKGD
ncbi:MAG: HipA domain-containing protein [Bdellovibrionales bacterium]|nr:HipA domain-containing protein [Bdellovibrionales bacterium]